jgi:hypothetical protein
MSGTALLQAIRFNRLWKRYQKRGCDKIAGSETLSRGLTINAEFEKRLVDGFDHEAKPDAPKP